MNWNSINIKQGQEVIEATKIQDRVKKEIAVCAAIFKKPIEYYETMPRTKLIQLIKKTDWISKMPESRFQAPFRNGNYLYKFKSHPNQLSQSDFVLLQKYGVNYVENLHQILAILSIKFRIIPTKQIDKMDFETRSELFLNKMPFGLAYSYCLFFSTYYPALLQIGQAYLEGQRKAAEAFMQTP